MSGHAILLSGPYAKTQKMSKAKAQELESLRNELCAESNERMRQLEKDAQMQREEAANSASRNRVLEEESKMARDQASKVCGYLRLDVRT